MVNPFQLHAPGLTNDPNWYRKAVFYEVLSAASVTPTGTATVTSPA